MRRRCRWCCWARSWCSTSSGSACSGGERRPPEMRTNSLGGMFSRTPYYVLTGGLAILFLFPLVWSTVASFSAQAGSAQTFGYGLGNYQRLFDFQEGLPRYFANSVVI